MSENLGTLRYTFYSLNSMVQVRMGSGGSVLLAHLSRQAHKVSL